MSAIGKTAVVTGGGRDIGRAITLRLAEQGANVLFTWCGSADQAEQTLRDAASLPGRVEMVRADLTEADAAAAVISSASSHFGEGIDILVNNAGGIGARKALAEMDWAFLDHVMRLNFYSTFAMTKACAAVMRPGGSIINVASQAGRDGGGGGAAAYASSKGAVMTFTRAMAKELGPRGIRVNAACPGMIATRFHDEFTSDEIRAKVSAATPLRREGQAGEVADMVAWLASEQSSFVSGACLDINGGGYFS